MSFKELVGKKIDSLALTEYDDILKFGCGEHDLHYRADGDCCADTWFYHISNLDALIGGTVSSVDGEKETASPYMCDEDDETTDSDPPRSYEHWGSAQQNSKRGMEHKDNKDGYGSEEAGFWRIHTDKGTCTIEVRNAHNGYYGGRVYLIKDTDENVIGHPYRAPDRKTPGYDLIPWKWRQLTEDM